LYHLQTNVQMEQPNGTLKQIIQIEKRSYFFLTYNEIFSQILEKYNACKYSTTNLPSIFIETKDLSTIKPYYTPPTLSSEPLDWKEIIYIVVLEYLRKVANKAIHTILKSIQHIFSYLENIFKYIPITVSTSLNLYYYSFLKLK
jgi:hypothetical protein